MSAVGFQPAGFNTFRDQFGSFEAYGEAVLFPLLLAESWLNLLGWQIREFEAEYRTFVMASFMGHAVPVVPIAIALWNRRLAMVTSLKWKRESDKVHRATPAGETWRAPARRSAPRVAARKDMRKALWRASLRLLVIVACIVALLYVLQEMLVIAVIVFLYGCLIMVMIAVSVIGARAWYSDVCLLNAARITSTMERATIEEWLRRLKTQHGRRRFMEMLASHHVIARSTWTKGRVPFKSDDPASDELLRLEERWLNLDR